MKKSNDIFYGLDIQKEYIAVVQYAADSNSVSLVALQPIADIGGGSAAVSKELGILKSKFKFDNPMVNCSLSAETAIIKRVPVDPGEKDIDAALTWELSQNVVGTPDEYVFDYLSCESVEQENEYLLIAYRKERVTALAALLRQHKLVPRFIDLDIFALINLFETSYHDYTGAPAVIVHAETAHAHCIYTQFGRLVDYEPLLYHAEPDPQTFAAQLQTAIARFCGVNKSNGAPPCFMSGVVFSQESFFQNVQSVIPASTLLHPFQAIECRISVDEEKLANYLPQLTVAVGLALRGDK